MHGLLLHYVTFLYGYVVSTGDGWRSNDPLKCPHCQVAVTYQELLYANGRSKVKTGGAHGDRCAVDLILRVNGEMAVGDKVEYYRPLGLFWESLDPNAIWGGRFGLTADEYTGKIGWDPGHFELGS